MAIMRGVLGTLTLISLIIDKWTNLDVTKYIGSFIRVNDLIGFNSIVGIIEILIGILTLALKFYNTQNIRIVLLNNKRIVLYVIIVLLLLPVYPTIIDIESARILLSLIGCFVFIIFELALTIYSNKQNKEVTSNAEKI